MQRAIALYSTTIGRKAVVAVTGVILFGYVIGHFVGNMLIYAGPDAINEYAASLRRVPPLLWGVRLALVISIPAHIIASLQLAARNEGARETPYRMRKDVVTNYAAKTMQYSGPLIGLFVVYHLAHLTFGVAPYEFNPDNVYNNLVYGFQIWWISALYIGANIALGLHLYHGAWSFLQTLGLNHPKYNRFRRPFAAVFAIAIAAGNVSFPISVMSGFIQPTDKVYDFPELG